MAKRVETGCRDCKKCTNSAAANLGRNSVRASTAVMTVGISELAMGFTKTCRGCGHKMSLHLGAQATTPQPTVTVQQPTPTQGPPPGWYPDAQGANRWWDGAQWTEHVQPATPPVPPAARTVRPDRCLRAATARHAKHDDVDAAGLPLDQC